MERYLRVPFWHQALKGTQEHASLRRRITGWGLYWTLLGLWSLGILEFSGSGGVLGGVWATTAHWKADDLSRTKGDFSAVLKTLPDESRSRPPSKTAAVRATKLWPSTHAFCVALNARTNG